jgi:hypothetical protein
MTSVTPPSPLGDTSAPHRVVGLDEEVNVFSDEGSDDSESEKSIQRRATRDAAVASPPPLEASEADDFLELERPTIRNLSSIAAIDLNAFRADSHDGPSTAPPRLLRRASSEFSVGSGSTPRRYADVAFLTKPFI